MKMIDYLNQEQVKTQLVVLTFNGVTTGKTLVRIQMANEYYQLKKKGLGSREAQKQVASRHNVSARSIRAVLEFMMQDVKDPASRQKLKNTI